MDVVYLVKPEEQQYELRYSLRSLQNLPHDHVVFAGHLPSWADKVDHLETHQVPGHKHPNALRNMRAALESDRVSDPFVMANDDHFIMRPVDALPVYNWGSAQAVIDNYSPRGSQYHGSMIATAEILHGLGFEDPISYELHVPQIVHKADLADVMDRYPNTTPGVWLHYMTLAGNIHGWGGEVLDRDVKVYDVATTPDWVSSVDFLSTTDASFNRGGVGNYIRSRFAQPGPYER